MEMITLIPITMLIVFAGLSLQAWRNEQATEKLFTYCFGWSMVAVISLVFGIVLFSVEGVLIPTALIVIASMSAFIAVKFKNAQHS